MMMLFGSGGILGSSGLLFVYCGFMFFLMTFSFTSSFSFLVEISLIKVSSFSFSFPILFSRENYLATSVVCLISACVLVYSKAYMDPELNFNRFMNLVCLFVLSMNLLIFIPSLLFLFLGWDGLGIVSFILVIYYQNKNSLGAGMITVLTNRIGDVFLFFSISVMSCLGYWCWEGLQMSKSLISDSDFFLLSMSIVVAGMTKSAQFPFCAWLPAAMAAPTPVSALVHSSTLVTAGVFLLCRFSDVLLENSEVCQFLMLMSLATMVVSGLICCIEYDMKKVIAFSTLSQLGVMMFSVSLGLISFGFFHLVTHAVFKALMFLCAGFVIFYTNHSQDFRSVGGFWWKSPVVSGSILSSVFCLSGMPFLSGFYSKDLILEEFLMSNISFMSGFCLVFATVLTVGYSVRLCWIVLFGKNGLEISSGGVSFYYLIPLLLLESVSIFEGNFIQEVFNSYSSCSFVFQFVKSGMAFIFVLGLLLGMSIMNTKKSNYFSMYFLFTTMFLKEFSGQVYTKKGMNIAKSTYEVLDQGLFESVVGGSGFSHILKSISKIFMQMSFVNSIYVMSFYCMLLLSSFGVFSFFMNF